MNKKEKILNEMLENGYIDYEKFQEWKLNENFSDKDAEMYNYIAKAYADDRRITFDEFKERINNVLQFKYF